MKAFIALPEDDLGLARAIIKLYGMEGSMAACLRGIGMARTCDPSRLERQSQSQRLGTDGCWPAQVQAEQAIYHQSTGA